MHHTLRKSYKQTDLARFYIFFLQRRKSQWKRLKREYVLLYEYYIYLYFSGHLKTCQRDEYHQRHWGLLEHDGRSATVGKSFSISWWVLPFLKSTWYNYFYKNWKVILTFLFFNWLLGNYDGERSNADIAKPAKCEPELQSVPFKDENNHDPSIVYLPPCTRIKRCGGCCSHSLLSCQPVATEMRNFKVIIQKL